MRRTGPGRGKGVAAAAALAAWAAAPWGCGGDGVHVDPDAEPPTSLSAYNFFTVRDGVIEYHPDLIPYTLNTPLFSDYALKSRAIYVPPGTAATFDEHDVFEFPVGSAIVKSFSFAPDLRSPDRDVTLVETRVLVRRSDGWDGLPYVWEPDGSDATLQLGGAVRTIDFVDPSGEARTAQYLIPQKNQCGSCHEQLGPGGARELDILGPTARNLHRDNPAGTQNQLREWAERGALSGLPDPSSIEPAFHFDSFDPEQLGDRDAAAVERAARDYLDANCAHCHSRRGPQGVTSQLFLTWDETDQFHLGVCKRPGSAGSGAQVGEYDVEPGEPDRSILLFRLETEEVGAMMPLLGRSLRHDAGAALVRAWIEEMPGSCP